MTGTLRARAVETPLERIDGPAKVTGTAPYAFEHPVGRPAYVHPVQADIGRGRVRDIDTADAERLDGVLAVLTHRNAMRLADTSDGELSILQDDRIAYRGQLIGAVIGRSAEIARHGAELVRVSYEPVAHDTELAADRDDLYTPEQVNPTFETNTAEGAVQRALSTAEYVLDQTYSTPMEHNNPMEPHSCTAIWDPGGDGPTLTLYDSTQGPHPVRLTLAPILGLDPERVRVIAPYVGGGFGSKGLPHSHNVLACLAARLVAGTPVKLALTRQQMFTLAGYRTPTIQRMRLGADAEGRLSAVAHDVVEQTSTVKEFAEQTAVCSRMMYAAPNRETSHRLAALDVPVPSWMRAPGEAPGMFASEVAMDELAEACGVDPIELRARNDPDTDPESGKPWSARNLTQCLWQGAWQFGWRDRPADPGTRQEDGWLVGLGVASSTYPCIRMTGSVAAIEYGDDGRYHVRIGSADIGTGTWTALTQIAADALEQPVDRVLLEIGDTDLPFGTVEGGSSGITSWGSTVIAAAERFREDHGGDPEPGARSEAGTPENPDLESFAVHSFGAQFAEARVHVRTGEVRVPRMLGVFSVGRVINPRTARSQLIGGMTMGMSMALHEHSMFDHGTGHVVNHDLAQYHIPTCADAAGIEATWLDEEDPHANPMGSKGIGEIGIVGSPAAIACAVYNATGIRVRDLPITPDVLVR